MIIIGFGKIVWEIVEERSFEFKIGLSIETFSFNKGFVLWI